MKYLIIEIIDDATEDEVRDYAEFLLETASSDEVMAGQPTPFGENYFVGDIKDVTAKP